jgi:putative nucleotidyltransferase with HDIG domain
METGKDDIVDMELAIPPLMPRFIVVDDDESIRRLLVHIITARYPECAAAGDLASARRLLAESHFDIMMLDLTLTDGSGTELLDERGPLGPEGVVVVITGQQELQTAIEVIRRGAFDYVIKPFSRATIEERLDKAVQEWRSRVRGSYYKLHLERLVNAMTEKLLNTNERIEAVYDMTVAALGSALDLRDPETHEHCRRVTENSLRLGAAMGLADHELKSMRWSAYLHDIGKIGIPERILAKTSTLTEEERNQIKEHPLLGFRMISSIEFLKDATEVVLYHHEKFDGSGYPYGLKGEGIPLAARVFAVVDAMDAMLYDRPYRKALPFSALKAELIRESGRHFDPSVVETFLGFPETAWHSGKTEAATRTHSCFARPGEANSPERRHV